MSQERGSCVGCGRPVPAYGTYPYPECAADCPLASVWRREHEDEAIRYRVRILIPHTDHPIEITVTEVPGHDIVVNHREGTCVVERLDDEPEVRHYVGCASIQHDWDRYMPQRACDCGSSRRRP